MMSCAASPAPTTNSGAACEGRFWRSRHSRRRLRTAMAVLTVRPVAKIGTDRGTVAALGAHTSTLSMRPTSIIAAANAINSSKLAYLNRRR